MTNKLPKYSSHLTKILLLLIFIFTSGSVRKVSDFERWYNVHQIDYNIYESHGVNVGEEMNF